MSARSNHESVSQVLIAGAQLLSWPRGISASDKPHNAVSEVLGVSM